MRRSYFIFLGIVLLATCTSQAPQVLPTSIPSATPTSTAIPTVKPTQTEIPTATAIPGFEDWSVLNPAAVEIKSDGDTLTMTLLHRALWFMNQRGVFLYKPVSGNFKITADVHTAKRSDPAQPPGGDGTVQLGGLMARNGKGGQENYVFIVAGDDGDGLSVETKNTLDSFSKYQGPAWDSADAELRLCRVEQTFHLYKRHVGSTEAWQLADSFDRADLPDELQVGVNIYTDSQPDLQIQYSHVTIEPLSSTVDCET
jgi:hypothetical protein